MIELPGYKVGSLLGDGGMASVYRGTQLSLRRPVAIKVLKKNLLGHSEIRKRFERESLIIARLNHPNIISVIDQGIMEDGRPFFIMDYVKSINFKSAMERGGMTYSRALDIFIQIAKALAYAHKNKVIHCDIKPENILVDFEGFARVLDFGIAQIFEENDSDDEAFVMGSYRYMAPEQHESSARATEKSDIYSFGTMMYLFFTKRLPARNFPPPIEVNPDVSQALNQLILQCLETDPEARPNSADEIQHRLVSVSKDENFNDRQDNTNEDLKKAFKLLDVIKDESSGGVYLYEEQDTRSLLIMKKKSLDSPGFSASKKLAANEHPNIAKVVGASKTKRSFILILEYCPGGTLAERMAQGFDSSEFYSISQGIASAMVAAHAAGVVHGNLRPSNILFSDYGDVKLSDFALEEYRFYGDKSNRYRRQGEPDGKRADIFAAGVVFYQMLTGDLPEWKEGRLMRSRSFTKAPESIQLLIRKMLTLESEKRSITFTRVLKTLNDAYGGDQTQILSLSPKTPAIDLSSEDMTVARTLHTEIRSEEDASDAAHSREAKPAKTRRNVLVLVLLLSVLLALFSAQGYLLYTDTMFSTLEEALEFGRGLGAWL
ncbi:MAG: serine/threonine protein kinase [Alteromonadaceae bacterium]|nr:MAG: serine/threonine protein kinase [Alteromonadaceae bacterium]